MHIKQATLDDVLDQCGRLARAGQSLRPEQAPLAALDADGTLWGADVAELLWERLIAERALTPRAVPSLAGIVLSAGERPAGDPYRDYATIRALRSCNRISEETVVRAMLHGLAGLTQTQLYEHAEQAIRGAAALAPNGAGVATGLVRSLRENGYRVIVVSGSPRWAVEVAAAPLGIHATEILAGTVSIVDGVLTDGILEPLPFGAGKIQAILRRYGSVPKVSMGNSLGDLPMLEATSHLRLLMEPQEELLNARTEIRGAVWSLTR